MGKQRGLLIAHLAVLLSLGCVTSPLVAGTCVRSFATYRGWDQTDYAVPVVLREGVGGFAHAGVAANGADLCVSDGTTASLPREIASWNVDGTSIVWVKVPFFTRATTLTFSWGADAAASPDTTNLWPDSVVHLHLPAAKDSSSYNASFSRVDNTAVETGPLGPAATFGTEGRRLVAGNYALPKEALNRVTNTFSISFWMRLDNLEQQKKYVVYNNHSSGQVAVIYGYNGQALELFDSGTLVDGSGNLRGASWLSVPDTCWHHYAWVYNGSVLRTYRDGGLIKKTDLVCAYKPWTGGTSLRMGGANSSGSFLAGALSEFRWEAVVRTAQELQVACEVQAATLPGAELTLSFPEYTGAETLTNFPALVSFDQLRTGFGPAFVSAFTSGYVDFWDTDGNPLESECEMDGFDTQTERTWWVKVPRFAAGTQIIARAHPGRTERSTYFASANSNVWADAVGVWHVNAQRAKDDAMGKRPIASGTLGPNINTQVDGPTGYLGAMQTGTNTITASASVSASSFDVTNRWTISFWSRKDDFAHPKKAYVFFWYPNTGVQNALITSFGDSSTLNKFYLYTSDTTRQTGGSNARLAIPDSDWHHYALVSDGTRMRGYVDGVESFSVNQAYDFKLPKTSTATVPFYVGCSTKAENGYLGAFDEIRLLREPRSAAWIQAEYANGCVWKKGVPHVARPAFLLGAESVTKGMESVAFTAALSCKQASDVTFCWGTADGGESLAGWASTRALGSCADGALAEQVVSGLGDDVQIVARFCASNAAGVAWSPLLSARTPTARVDISSTIRVTGFAGAETLTNFPVCVRLPAAFRLPASAAGLRFSATDGTPLAYEVESWVPAGESVVWVRVPHLAAGTEIRASWRTTDDGEAWSGDPVWDDTYARVFHCAPADVDSSRSGSVCEKATIGTNTAGIVGGAFGFNGVGGGLHRYSMAPFYAFGAGFTISCWAKIEEQKKTYLFAANRTVEFPREGSATTLENEVIYGYNGDLVELFLRYVDPKGYGSFWDDAVFRTISGIPRGDDAWHQYAWTYDGRELSAWKDGVCLNRGMVCGTVGSSDSRLRATSVSIGSALSQGAPLKGAMDEMRIETCGRSDAWMRASYANEAGKLLQIGEAIRPGMIIVFR